LPCWTDQEIATFSFDLSFDSLCFAALLLLLLLLLHLLLLLIVIKWPLVMMMIRVPQWVLFAVWVLCRQRQTPRRRD